MSERILVRTTNWLGDLVMSTPALAMVRKNYPDAEITALVRPPLDMLIQGNPAVDKVILFDKKGVHSGPAGIARLAGDLRKRKFHRAILFQNAFEAALIAFLANIPERVGYKTDGRGLLLTRGVKVTEEARSGHQVYYYSGMLAAAGLKGEPGAPRLYLDRKDHDYAARVLRENGIRPDELIIGINPGAQYGVAKKWHPERFGHAADSLIREFGARMVVFGAAADMSTAGAVQASMKKKALNMAGRTSVRELMALIKRCRLFITNDSGPMHIAAALGVPTLAIFGSTSPVATGPFGSINRVVREPVTCSPCLKRTCPRKSYECMERITVARVLKNAREMLGA